MARDGEVRKQLLLLFEAIPAKQRSLGWDPVSYSDPVANSFS